MSYLKQKIKEYFPISYSIIVLPNTIIEKLLFPIIDKKINDRLHLKEEDIIIYVNTLIRSVVESNILKTKVNINNSVKQILTEKLEQVNIEVENKVREDVNNANKTVEERTAEVDKLIAKLPKNSYYTCCTELEKLVMRLCLDMEKRYPRSNTGKIKKHGVCLEIDKINILPDKKLQWLRQSSRPVDSTQFIKIMNELIDKVSKEI